MQHFEWDFDPRQSVSVILVLDSTGLAFAPDSCAHTYTFNIDQTLNTDTATDPLTSFVRVKTYVYTSGLMTGESAWVKQ